MPTCSWFKIEPNSGQYANNFRLVTPSESMALYSRSTEDPTFFNLTSTKFFTDHLFYFMWEDMGVDRIKYKTDAGKILTSTPITLGEQMLTNTSGTEQEMSFSVNQSVTRSSTFEYSGGFTITLGMKFKGG